MLPSNEIDTHQQAYIQQKREAAMAEASTNESSATSNTFPTTASKCNKCHQKPVVLLDGCATCLNCGDSKCGQLSSE